MTSERDERIIEAWRTGDDETFIREISMANLEAAYRPRDEWDNDLHPDSFRAHILAVREAFAAIPWWLWALHRVTWPFVRGARAIRRWFGSPASE